MTKITNITESYEGIEIIINESPGEMDLIKVEVDTHPKQMIKLEPNSFREFVEQANKALERYDKIKAQL